MIQPNSLNQLSANLLRTILSPCALLFQNAFLPS